MHFNVRPKQHWGGGGGRRGGEWGGNCGSSSLALLATRLVLLFRVSLIRLISLCGGINFLLDISSVSTKLQIVPVFNYIDQLWTMNPGDTRHSSYSWEKLRRGGGQRWSLKLLFSYFVVLISSCNWITIDLFSPVKINKSFLPFILLPLYNYRANE